MNAFPQHEFSNLIDLEFNYSNRVDRNKSEMEMIHNLESIDCGGISLEPRLQEYIKKKRYYANNNIKPVISLEKEYQITRNDLKIVQAFFRGKKNMYDSDKYNEYKNKKNEIQGKQYFPSKSFRDNDPRLKKIKDMQAEKIKSMNRTNFGKNDHSDKNDDSNDIMNLGMFMPEKGGHFYEGPMREIDEFMDARDLQNCTGKFKNNLNNDFRNEYILSDLKSGKMNRGPQDKYNSHQKPKPMTNKQDYLIGGFDNSGFGMGTELDDLYDSNKSNKFNSSIYRSSNNSSGLSEKSKIDKRTGVVIPKMTNNSNRGQTMHNYTFDDFGKEFVNGINYDNETMLSRGYRDSGKKSLTNNGNYSREQYIDHIDHNIQQSAGKVTDYLGPRGGYSTRQKEGDSSITTGKSRDIY